MQINSIPVLNSEIGREKVKTIGVPAILTAGATLIATKAPKGVEDTFKLSTRIGKATKAGLITAAVMALLTTKKDEIALLGRKVKEGFSNLRNKNNENKQVVNTDLSMQNPLSDAEKIGKETLDAVAPITNPLGATQGMGIDQFKQMTQG